MSAPVAGSERLLCESIAYWLRDRGFEVYAEVPVVGYGVADLVGRDVSRGMLLVVEAKLGDGWELLWQTSRWAGRCTEAWAAVPWSPARTERERGIAAVIAEAYEHVHIGRLEVSVGRVSTAVRAHRFESFIDCGLDAACIPDRLWTPEKGAGLPGAPRWTASTPIRESLVRLVADFPEKKPRFYAGQLGEEFPGQGSMIGRVLDEATAGRIAAIMVLKRPGYSLLAPAAEKKSEAAA